jgi:hypothetical protein
VLHAGHNSDRFGPLSAPVLERILDDAFKADKRSVAARAQLGLVCKCDMLQTPRMHTSRMF